MDIKVAIYIPVTIRKSPETELIFSKRSCVFVNFQVGSSYIFSSDADVGMVESDRAVEDVNFDMVDVESCKVRGVKCD